MKAARQSIAARPGWSGHSLLTSGALTVVMFGILPLAHVLTQPDVDALVMLRNLDVTHVPPPPPLLAPERPPPDAPPEQTVPIELPSFEPATEAAPPALDLPASRPAFGLSGGVGIGSGYWPVLDRVFDLGEVDVPPQALVQVPPQYPHAARRSGLEGSVLLEFLVTDSGRVDQIRLVESRPGTVFVAAAKAAIAQWRFEPARYRGDPVPVRVTLPVDFQLE